jgi:hypothetical protein
MSELYRHLLIPKDHAFVPERYQVAAFFDELEAVGALPKETEFIVITNSGETRAIAKNPTTGEVYYGPDLKISRFSDSQRAVDSMNATQINELWGEAKGPAAISPFDLYRAHSPDVLWSGPYSFTIRCKLRHQITHILHSAFGCKCDVRPFEPAIFENPWNKQPIQTSGLASAQFWIEFGIGDWLMPMITDRLEILDPRLVKLANNIFRAEFTQGCMCNDD